MYLRNARAATFGMAQQQADVASGLLGDEEAVPQNGHGTYAVFSVLSNVLDKDEVSLREFEEKDRPKVPLSRPVPDSYQRRTTISTTKLSASGSHAV